jgi:hypothetical protein
VPGTVDIIVRNPSSNPSGNVLIATLNFEVIFQLIAPPATAGTFNETAIDIRDYELWDTSILIPTDPEVDGLVRIYAYVLLRRREKKNES